MGKQLGIFLKCDTRIQTLRRHLRGFLTVRGPSGNKLLFRYYDPRVLRVYLPSCSSEDLRTVFGPIERIWTEGEPAEKVVEFGFDGTGLVSNDFPIGSSAARPAFASKRGMFPRLSVASRHVGHSARAIRHLLAD